MSEKTHIDEAVGRVIAIDPGTEQSAIIIWDGQRILGANLIPNSDALEFVRGPQQSRDRLVIEMVASYGMPVGREVFETVFWIGRFFEAWQSANPMRGEPNRVYRKDIKIHHCGNVRAKDSNIRQALIDKYGGKGVKAAPGVTYGLKKDLWAAFALATYATETRLAPTADKPADNYPTSAE